VLLLAALVLAVELMPLELGRPGTRDSTTMSQPFAVALGAAGALYELAGGDPGRAQVSPPAFVAAALAFLVVNNLLLEAVLVLAGGTPALDRVRQGVGLRAWVAAMLLGMAPVVMVVAETSLGLTPILARATAAEQARLVEGEQALIRRLQESDRLKRDLLATVSHELKTPLTVILGTLGTLSRRGAALDPAERREFVDMAVRQGTRLKELIEQLLLAARFEQTGREPAERPLVDAAVLARDALAAARVAHPGRELVLVAREALPVRAAPEAVLQVLNNLLDNAAKYAPDHCPVRLETASTAPWPCWPSRTPAPACRAPTASAASNASPSSTRGRPGGPAASASGCASPDSWPTPRAASCCWPRPPRPARAPASSSASPWPTGARPPS
jgi:signal transduction histidine kinase